MKPKLIDSAFSELFDKLKENEFIPTPINEEYVKEFNECIECIKVDLQRIHLLEVLILQINATEFNTDQIRLINVNGYINASRPFFRMDTKAGDIRGAIGSVNEIGNDFEIIKSNESLMNVAKEMLISKMLIQINQTKEKLKC